MGIIFLDEFWFVRIPGGGYLSAGDTVPSITRQVFEHIALTLSHCTKFRGAFLFVCSIVFGFCLFFFFFRFIRFLTK